MLVGNLTIHQGVQSLRGTVTVDLWTFLFFSIFIKSRIRHKAVYFT